MMADPKLTPGQRWEQGVAHDPRSVEIYKAIEKIDFEENGDSLCLKSGGDGDNGESLMYLLDCYFARNPGAAETIERLRAYIVNRGHARHCVKAGIFECICGYDKVLR